VRYDPNNPSAVPVGSVDVGGSGDLDHHAPDRKRHQMTLLDHCICGATGGITGQQNDIPIITCLQCGIVRQDLWATADELARWYEERYHAGIYTHSKEHDLEVAERRLKSYGLAPGLKLLDVGAGNGAFVQQARAWGLDAWGQDMARQSETDHIYVGPLEEVAFPTADFDYVTIHDVLEHVPDPVAFLAEIRRIVKPGGLLIVDFPRFWHEAGVHHWKLTEHLWMLTGNQLLDLLQKAGFDIEKSNNPIPSKIVVASRALPLERTRILVPAGIGDAYWVMTKLKGFLKEKGITVPPEIVVQDAGGPRRTDPFLKTVPFVYAGGYEILRTKSRIWKEAYLCDGRTVFEKPPFPGNIDWFIAYNGVMRFGKSLEDVDPQWPCDWFFRQHITKEALAFKKRCQADGPYAIVYLTDGGMYQEWLKAFPPERIAETLKRIQALYGLRMIFIGAEWDREMTGERLAQYGDASWIDLVGETNYNEMIGALLGANLVFGYPAGNTILAATFKIPSVLLWHDYFDVRFWHNICPLVPTYAALNTQGLTVDMVVEATERVLLARER
jgi:2-polyprenyl-3-methyl-5-hydroxy-6-metoxy-1,4-benzoquinol methylase